MEAVMKYVLAIMSFLSLTNISLAQTLSSSWKLTRTDSIYNENEKTTEYVRQFSDSKNEIAVRFEGTTSIGSRVFILSASPKNSPNEITALCEDWIYGGMLSGRIAVTVNYYQGYIPKSEPSFSSITKLLQKPIGTDDWVQGSIDACIFKRREVQITQLFLNPNTGVYKHNFIKSAVIIFKTLPNERVSFILK